MTTESSSRAGRRLKRCTRTSLMFSIVRFNYSQRSLRRSKERGYTPPAEAHKNIRKLQLLDKRLAVLDGVGAEFRTRSHANNTEGSDLPGICYGKMWVSTKHPRGRPLPTRNYRILRHQLLSIDQRILRPSTPGKHSDHTEEIRDRHQVSGENHYD
jgi:hypothetical protein